MPSRRQILINIGLNREFHQIDNRHLAFLMLMVMCTTDPVLRIRNLLHRIDMLVMSQEACVLLLLLSTFSVDCGLSRHAHASI